MQVHSPNHTSAGIYYLCDKPHWRTEPDEKKNNMLKNKPPLLHAEKEKLGWEEEKNKEGGGGGVQEKKKQKDIEKASFARPVSQYHSSLGSCTNGWVKTLCWATGNMSDRGRDCFEGSSAAMPQLAYTVDRLVIQIAKGTFGTQEHLGYPYHSCILTR